MTHVFRYLQLIGLLLVGIGLFHGLFDQNPSEGMWSELWYLLSGAGLFYGCQIFLRKRG